MNKRVIALVLLISMAMSIFIENNYTSAADKKTSHTATDGIATVTKSAKWINEGKTEAEISIEVETEKKLKEEQAEMKNADIIFIVDRSETMGKYVSLSRATIENDIVKKAATYFITGAYANSGNRVAFADFSSSLMLFKSDKAAAKNANGNQKYLKTYGFRYDKTLTSTNSISSATEAKNELMKSLKKVPASLNFYSDAQKVSNMIWNASIYNGEKGDTDFNLPILWSQCLLENRKSSEQTRKSYIVFVTDGQPWPTKDSNRRSQARGTSWRNATYVANKFAIDAAKNIRSLYDTDIYTIIIDTNRADYGFWNKVTGDTGASKTKNTKHVYSIANTNDSSVAKNKMNEILGLIQADMKKESVKTQNATLNATLTDNINTELFELLSANANVTLSTNIGVATISDDMKQVTWKFSGIEYGEKCSDGKWPTLKIKVKLKDANRYGDDLNTNSIIPKDDQCELIHPEGDGVKVPTPWLSRESLKRNVTIQYIDDETDERLYTLKIEDLEEGTRFPNDGSIRSKYAIKDLKGTFGIPDYELVTNKMIVDGKTYTSINIPNSIVMNENKTIQFYYRKKKASAVIRTFIVNKLDDVITGIINNSEKSINIVVDELQENAAPTTEKYEYLGYRFQKNHPLTIDTKMLNQLDSNETIVDYVLENGEIAYIDFYYLNQEYTYDATVKYIDNNTQQVLYKIDNPQIKNFSIFPSYGTFSSRYLIKDLKGTLGINGYEWMDKVIINGKQYTAANMPNTLTMDEDKVVEFYYRPENTNANIRTFIVTRVDDKIVGIKNNSAITQSAYVDTEYQKEAPNLPNYQYLGYTVNYNEIPIVTSKTINSLDPNQKVAKYKLSNDEQKVYVDFIYLESFYTVTVKYQDTHGNKILDDVVQTVRPGDIVDPNVPNQINTNNTIYDYSSRSDRKYQTASIGPINAKTVVIITYKSRGHNVRIKYKDIITNETIAPDVVAGNIPEYSTYTPTEDGVPSKYTFVTRSDGKLRKAGIEITTEDKEVTFYYVNMEGAPVVSYPEVVSSIKENNRSVAILGEEMIVKIPSNGKHNQMYDLGIQEPANGWNSVYAKSEYLKFSCDVIWNNQLIKAGELIKIAENTKSGIGTQTIKVIIPEYVKDENQTVTAIVSNLIQNKKDTSSHTGYNQLYDENEAVGVAEFKVKGKIYDFTISNLVGDNFWPTSLFNNISGYKANANESKQIASLPIGQRTNQNPAYKYGIALGSSFYFNINTIGLKNEKIVIEPRYVYVDNDGKQQDVDIYYRNASSQYRKLPIDSEMVFNTRLNSGAYKARTNLVNEIAKALKLYGNNKYNVVTNIGMHKQLTLDNNVKTPFIDYITEENKSHYLVMADAIKDEVLKAANHWYGYYSLPYTTTVMQKGANTSDSSKEIKTGFIIVLFKITSIDENGQSYLIYDNQFVGNQWKNEGGASNGESVNIQLPITQSSKNVNANIVVENGFYPVAVYGVGTKLNYDTSGIY